MGKTTLNIGEEQARIRIRKFCDYRERNHREVREKLYEMGLYREQVDNLIAELLQEDLLNEERYARAFARGKFRIKQWGKVKITYALKQQQIGAYCIKQALREIDEEAYVTTLRDLTKRKHEQLYMVKNKAILRQKLYAYLQQKGYEPQFIFQVIGETL